MHTTAQTPAVEANFISQIMESFGKPEDPQLIENLKNLGFYETYLEKQKESESDITSFLKLVRPKVNSVLFENPLDLLEDINTEMDPINFKTEQQNGKDIQTVIQWKRQKIEVDLKYEPISLKKYHKQLRRLIIEDEILYRIFYHDTGKMQFRRYCLPANLWKAVLYRIHNSKTAGLIGIDCTLQEFRRRFYFPNFTEHLLDLIKNCLTNLQMKNVKGRQLKSPMQPLSSLQSFPGDLLQIDLVGTFNSPVYKYVLSGIDVFT